VSLVDRWHSFTLKFVRLMRGGYLSAAVIVIYLSGHTRDLCNQPVGRRAVQRKKVGEISVEIKIQVIWEKCIESD
jgi:hypothetical protein